MTKEQGTCGLRFISDLSIPGFLRHSDFVIQPMSPTFVSLRSTSQKQRGHPEQSEGSHAAC